jgi:hypothetical protein
VELVQVKAAPVPKPSSSSPVADTGPLALFGIHSAISFSNQFPSGRQINPSFQEVKIVSWAMREGSLRISKPLNFDFFWQVSKSSLESVT